MRKAFFSLVVLGLVLATASPALADAAAPPTPIDLFNGYQACSTDPSSPVYLSGDAVIEARSLDTTDVLVTETFQVWPVSDPAQTITFTQSGVSDYEETASVPASDLANGQTYAWDVQASGSGGTSAWSSTCYFAMEDTGPASAPTVTSSNYPAGQANQGGAPIQLTFGANGDSDVGGYEFAWFSGGTLPVAGVADIGPFGVPQFINPYSEPQNFVQASTPGGSATVSLIPPEDTGFLVLTVVSLDQAFNQSPQTTFLVIVKPDGPTIDALNPNPKYGENAQFNLLPDPGIQAASPVTSYTVQYFGANPETITVPANADGMAHVGLILNDPSGINLMLVTSTSADGWTSQTAFWQSQINTTPVVSSNIYLGSGAGGGPGVPDTFTFDLKVKGIASFTYGFSDGTLATVAANGDGVAHISWTPQAPGLYFIEVTPTLKDGTQLQAYFNAFFVN